MNQLVKLGAVTLVATMLSVTTIDAAMSLSGHDITVEASKKSKAKAKRKMVNKEIDNELKIYQGMADGTMDADGNPIEGGTPDPEYGWAPYIYSIKYTADGDLNMVVLPEFNDLTKSNKSQLARSAQNVAFTILGDNYKKWAASYDRPYMYIFDSLKENSFPIGHSKAVYTNKFTFETE